MEKRPGSVQQDYQKIKSSIRQGIAPHEGGSVAEQSSPIRGLPRSKARLPFYTYLNAALTAPRRRFRG